MNRWAHGYAYTPNSLFDPEWTEEEKPWVIGRKPFGRIAIANSDAGANAYTNVAIDQAHRAVVELDGEGVNKEATSNEVTTKIGTRFHDGYVAVVLTPGGAAPPLQRNDAVDC